MKRWLIVLAFALSIPAVGTCAEHVRTLYLVRHGAYVADPKADPVSGPALTPLGIAQARLIGARLAGMPVHFDSMTSSTMTRAHETAAVMHETLKGVPFESSPLLTECTPPVPREVQGGSEKGMAECASRLDRVFSKYFTPSADADRNQLLVCHGNVIRYLVMKALKADPKGWVGMTVAHASLTIVQVRADGSMSVIGVGDIGHLPSNMVSWGTSDDPQLVAPN